uniref:G-protein coupled receptors family 1 profile domain-containing protein n=1 Tax=Pelusios castaneus TaxID=367368 RepID=A0A8C8SRB0_9SAUR
MLPIPFLFLFPLSVFFLIGIPGLQDMHLWISIPFSSMFLLALLGNFSLLYFIITEPSLHKPMFYFLSMLAFIDLVLSTSTIPKTLSIFWFNYREISFTACLVQMFFLHSFFHSAVLVAMAFDRYVAICNPLRYATILTNSMIAKIGLAGFAKGVLITPPFIIILSRLPFCRSRIISHCYCEHVPVLKLACANTTFSNIYGIFITLFSLGLDLMFIIMSYVKILRTVLSLASKEEQLKAFGTCVSHLCAILMFYTPPLLTSIIYRASRQVAPHIQILMANFSLLFPPVMNPIVYGVRTKQFHDRAEQSLNVLYLIWSKRSGHAGVCEAYSSQEPP